MILGVGCVLVAIFSAITWHKLGENASFLEGLIMSCLFSIIVWIYMWIKSLPFVFSKRKNKTEFETVSEELENCQKDVAALSAKINLYESKFDLYK